MPTDNQPTWRVVATNINTRERRILSTGNSESDADAFVMMAVMRRGVDNEFFTAEPEDV